MYGVNAYDGHQYCLVLSHSAPRLHSMRAYKEGKENIENFIFAASHKLISSLHCPTKGEKNNLLFHLHIDFLKHWQTQEVALTVN